MKRYILFSILGALPFVASTQTAPEVDTVTIVRPAYTITLPGQIYRMPLDQFAEYRGMYDLSDGQTLSVYNRGRIMYAGFVGKGGHEIVATGPDTFVARDKMLKMRIENHMNGEVSGEVYYVVPGAMQAGSAERIVMAQFMPNGVGHGIMPEHSYY